MKVERPEQQAAKVRATERRTADAVDKPWEGWELQLASPAAAAATAVADLEGAVVARGAFRLGPVDLDVRCGDRVVVIGPTAAARRTLLGALLGDCRSPAGTARLGPAVVVGELDQERAALLGDAAAARRVPRGAPA